MTAYDDERLAVLLAELERHTRRDAGAVRFEPAAAEKRRPPRLVGDRAGLLRLGVEIALAARNTTPAPRSPGRPRTPVRG